MVRLISCSVSLSILFILCHANAETITWQTPLVYEHNLDGPCAYESESVTTEGVLNTITANWKSSGVVHLKVSANNGLDYTPVINGVSLDKGFTPGNQLRYKAVLEPQSKLHRVTLSYTVTKGIRVTFGHPELSGFKFRKAIDILGSPETELFNYQIRIKLAETKSHVASRTSHGENREEPDIYCEGNIQADFKDIRFTTADEKTLLNFYLESISGKPGSRLATFWVKIPQLPKKDSPLHIYLYYGNNDAQDLSSAKEVFDFFEDFTGKELDLRIWQVRNELKGETKIVNGQLKLKNSAIVSGDFKLQDGIIEFKARVEGPCGIQGIVRDKKESSLYSTLAQTVYSSNFPGAEHTIAVGDMVKVNIGRPILADQDYIYRITAEGLNLTFERYNAKTGQDQAELHFSDIGGLTEGYIGLKGEYAKGFEAGVYFDWLRVRQYAKALPQVLSVGKEEEANSALFLGTTISKEGRLILEDNSSLGRYESKTILADFPVRIMSVDAKYPLNISADRGQTYKKDAKERRYYYASSRDFGEGQHIKWQVELKDNVKELERVSLNYYPGIITLVSPNGGEVFLAGSLGEILWSAQEYEPTYLFKIEYSLDRGRTYKTIVNETVNTGSFYWRVPEKIKSQEVLLKISDAKALEIYDTSDGVFSIISFIAQIPLELKKIKNEE